MTRKLIISIVACLFIGISIVLVLAAVSKDMKLSRGSFLREFPSHSAIEKYSIQLPFNSYYIAGATRGHVYLGNATAPLHMIVLTSDLTDSIHVRLDIKDISEQKFWSLKVKVDSPYFYLVDGAVPFIYKGNIYNWKGDRYQYDKAYFQDIVPLNDNSFFIRALSKDERQNTLGKLSSMEPFVNMKPGILTKQVDGIFCTDGMMHFDKVYSRMIYQYRYRNEFIVLDTNLNVIKRHHTIDTTSTADIRIHTMASTGSTTFASPPRIVNRNISAWNNTLFVNSNLLARNEHPAAHQEASVIDVYKIDSGEYRFSFYVYHFNGQEKLRQFVVVGNNLYALFDNNLQVWQLRSKYFGGDAIRAKAKYTRH